MKERQNEILELDYPHFLFLSPDSWVLYVLHLKDKNLHIILGPIPEQDRTEKLQHLIRLCNWLFQSNDTYTLPQPKTYTLLREENVQESQDLSLVHIYYEREFNHFPLIHGEYLKSRMLAGDLKAIQDFFDSYSNILKLASENIELAKGDQLRSSKNHLIAACGIACSFALEGGVDDEYARTLADQFILKAESIQTRSDYIKLVRDIFLKFTSSVIEFSNPDYSTLVISTIHYMHTHFFEKLTLDDVARKLGRSPSYISDKLNKETGQSFNENLNQIRIKESKQLLIHTQKSINEIAIAVGFDYQNYFARVFKKIVGVTPLQYRNKRGLS
ncbi:AraC family transcriptional regulator [Paenibacillus sp. D2_2]|uniref:helix-turn-helix transcriptional regulator n=1 Tax=Paenibacillus sp. D2_2 TaxID=3073092 RepID=UPI0028151118|nr:AraC family transcriptional regulator [Paenibacillus sp. D2_2]WMT43244.1 AraC family transcriptional regulator [Paenibacillus sp. D2_2]